MEPEPLRTPWITTRSGKRKRKRASRTPPRSPPVYQVEPEIWSRLPTDIKMSILQSDPTLAARVMMPSTTAPRQRTTFGPNPISLRDVRGSLAITRKGCVGDMITAEELMAGMKSYDSTGTDGLTLRWEDSSGIKMYHVTGYTLPLNELRQLAQQTGRPLDQIPRNDWFDVMIEIRTRFQGPDIMGGREMIPEVIELYRSGDLYWSYYTEPQLKWLNDDNFAFLRHVLSKRPGCHPGFLRGVPDHVIYEFLQRYGIVSRRRYGPYQKG